MRSKSTAPADPGGGQEPPCSDQKLCQLLAEEGYAVSRRTVAKYREELGVSSAVGRKSVNGSSSVGSCRIRLQNIGNGKKYSGFPCKDWMDMVHLYGTQPHGAVSLLGESFCGLADGPNQMTEKECLGMRNKLLASILTVCMLLTMLLRLLRLRQRQKRSPARSRPPRLRAV